MVRSGRAAGGRLAALEALVAKLAKLESSSQ
jgi:hypothetical protein